jgi:SAM-dependent methyltransferase
MTQRYTDLLDALRRSYDANAADRDAMIKQDWKLAERDAYLDRLNAVEAQSLLEIGAGPGVDAAFFRDSGLAVTAVDLSPEMVALCEAKGITAYARDFLDLGFGASTFDAAYGLNCLLHVPNDDLESVLRAVREVLRPGGLFFVGVYGGESGEGIAADDDHDPKRFFSFRTDEQILAYAGKVFEIIDFHTVDDGDLHFQALTLAKPLD